jgi:general secretion pathway protein G
MMMPSEASVRPRVTWIEIAIVGVVLAVLAALVVPQFSEAGMDPRARELRSAVQIVRGQVEMYRLQHDNQYPSLKQFTEQMTLPTNARGQIATVDPGSLEFGPYLRCIPANPYTGTSEIVGQRGVPGAWYYNEKTGEFRSNRLDVR